MAGLQSGQLDNCGFSSDSDRDISNPSGLLSDGCWGSLCFNVKYLMVEADHSHSNALVNNACNSISAYVFMVWCLIRWWGGGGRGKNTTFLNLEKNFFTFLL